MVHNTYGNSLDYDANKNLGFNNINSHIRKKSNKHTKSQDMGSSFAQQKVELADTPFLFFPGGLEKVFLAIYFVTLPYIIGLLFLFFYVADGKLELFSSLSQDSSFILTWAIGYEILAALVLLYIAKSAISFTSRMALNNGKRKNFRRP